MTATPQLEIPFALPLPTEPRRSPRQQWNDGHVSRGGAPYHPKRCRDVIMAKVGADRFTTFSSLCDATRVHPWLLDCLLCLLVRWGRLEKHELYFGTEFPLIHPGHGMGKYHGFQWGYRKPPAP